MALYKVRASEDVRQLYEVMVEAANEDEAHEVVTNIKGPLSALSGAKAISTPVVVGGEVYEVRKVS